MTGALFFYAGAENLAYITQRCSDDTGAGSNPSPSKKLPHYWVGDGGTKIIYKVCPEGSQKVLS